MGLFDIFKKKNESSIETSENGILGPTFLENHVGHIINPKNLAANEWRRKLKTTSGGTIFRIKYYGKRHSKYKNLIVETAFAPSKIYAVDIINDKELLIFDGCLHGYNAMFCDTYSDGQIKNRIADNIYTSDNGNDKFEIVVSIVNGVDYENEFRNEVDSDGEIELTSGKKMTFNEVKRNGFDSIQIWGINENGDKIEIISEELA